MHNQHSATRLFPTVALAMCFAARLVGATPETAPAFEWATSAGGLKNDKTRAINIDREGNVFLAGEVTGEVKFGDTTLKSAGGMDFFVAKLDSKGKFLWARLGGGSLIDRGYGVATDAAGNCYVTGHYQSTDADFGGTKLPNRGDYDIFTAKYDRDGKLVWIRTAGGKGYDYGHGIAVDEKGDIVVTGAVVGESQFGDVNVPNDPGSHIFCAKYHADGALVWVKTASGKAGGSGHGVAVDGKGNIYIGGLSSGSGEFGGKPLVTPKGSSAVVVKLSPQGEVRWITQQLGEPSCLFHEITCDKEGRVWASGMFKGKAVLGSETFTTTGDKDSDAFLCHFDTDGKLLWSRVGTGPAVDYGLGVATDGRGNSFVTGEFTDTFKFGGEELHSRGSTDMYVAKFDEKGALRWITQAGGDKGDNAYTMVCDAQGNLFFGGSFGGTAKFSDASITSGGSNDLYGAKLKAK
ncbi:MAG: SBBP repeat-containing protein [Chthoniobacteraceae bacterium]